MNSSPDRSASLASRKGQLAASLVIAGGVLAALLWRPATPAARTAADPVDAVRIAGPALVCVDESSPIARRLKVVEVSPTTIDLAESTATGSVLAILGATDGPRFASVDLAGLHADWQRARIECAFLAEQQRLVTDLVAARNTAREQAVTRLERLVETGSESARELAAARADLAEQHLEGRRQLQEAGNALAIAQRNANLLEQRLQLLGVPPNLLEPAARPQPVALVVAEVPEGRSATVRLGMQCEVRLLALGDRWLPGAVSAIAPGIAEDRRVLPIQFTVIDTTGGIRPGMFADVRLGTEPREALLVPAAGLLRLGRSDHLFVAAGPGTWRATVVSTGAVAGDHIEVRSGLNAGDRVLGDGAVLLRPLLAPALELVVGGGR